MENPGDHESVGLPFFFCSAHRCSLPSAHVDMGASVAEAFLRGVRAGVIAPGVWETGVAAVLRLNLRLQERLLDQYCLADGKGVLILRLTVPRSTGSQRAPTSDSILLP